MTQPIENSKILEKRVGARVVNLSPLVSVVIPAYNCAEFIAETLRSVFAQTFADYEIILVNDGSPDTEELEKNLENFFDKIIYVRQNNGGAAAARNTAIDCARGEFLAFLDGDDVWLPAYLDAQTAEIRAKNCDMIYTDALLFGAATTGKNATYMTECPSSGAVTAESLLSGNCNVITSGTMARREKILQVGRFDENLPPIVSEDFDLWFRLTKAGAKIDYQTRVLLKYRVRSTGLTGDSLRRAERAVAVLRSIGEKYDLTDAEKSVLKNRCAALAAELEIERAKRNLLDGNYIEARGNVREANKYFRKFKYAALASLLRIQPELALKLFKKARPAESERSDK